MNDILPQQIFRDVNNNIKYCATLLMKLGIKYLFIIKMSFFQTKMYKQIIKVISVEWKLPTMGHFGTLIEQHFARLQKHLGSVLFVVNDGQRPFLIHFLIYLQKKPRLLVHWGQIISEVVFLYYTANVRNVTLGPNIPTTPITAMGCRQCLPLSIVQLKGKHCRKPHCHNGVVDTFGLGFIVEITYGLQNIVFESTPPICQEISDKNMMSQPF